MKIMCHSLRISVLSLYALAWFTGSEALARACANRQ